MTDQAPVSSRHVRVRLLKWTEVPGRLIENAEITTEITRTDRAMTTVRMPRVPYLPIWREWWNEILGALRGLEGADSGIPFAGVSQTFTVEWDGICRPI